MQIIPTHSGKGAELGTVASSCHTPNSHTNSVLADFYQRLPPVPRCTDHLRQPHRRREKDQAATFRYVQYNEQTHIATLLVDVDHPEAAARHIDQDAPPPNIIIINPANGHAQYAYFIRAVYLGKGQGKKGRSHSKAALDRKRLLDEVQHGLSTWLGGDPSFCGYLATTKNPLHPDWRTLTLHGREYTLSELWLSLPPYVTASAPRKAEKTPAKPAAAQPTPTGRNPQLFGKLCGWAASRVSSYRKTTAQGRKAATWRRERAALLENPAYRTFEQAVIHQAEDLNTYTPPVEDVADMAERVACWAWTEANSPKRKPDRQRREDLKSWDRPTLTPEQRAANQQAGRQAAGQTKRNATRERIIQGI